MSIRTKLVGVTSKNEDGTRRQDILEEMHYKKWKRVTLAPEPDNPKSDHAVAAYNDAGEQIGYLNDDLAADLFDDISDIGAIYAEILQITGGDGKKYGCNILIQDIDDLDEEDKAIIRAPVPSNKLGLFGYVAMAAIFGAFLWVLWKIGILQIVMHFIF